MFFLNSIQRWDKPSVNQPVGLHVTQCLLTSSGSYDSGGVLVLAIYRHQPAHALPCRPLRGRDWVNLLHPKNPLGGD